MKYINYFKHYTRALGTERDNEDYFELVYILQDIFDEYNISAGTNEDFSDVGNKKNNNIK